ncbi:hypothetical protein EDB83DRAFT_2448163 [Lactarius deliciosus]|nr:hypothetical protein EDB83DRAFT_2448163 [Lactarius deliciosus]
MAPLLFVLTVIRRLYALGTFLGSHLKHLGLLFALCRKLTSTYRLRYCRGPVAPQKSKPVQSSSECLPLDSSFKSGDLAAAPSCVSAPSSRSYHQASIQSLTPGIGPSHQSFSLSASASTFQDSVTIASGLPDDIPLLDQRRRQETRIDVSVDAGSHVGAPHPAAPSETPDQISFPMNPWDTLRYERFDPISRSSLVDEIKPLTITFPHSPEPDVLGQGSLVSSWTPAAHPEGALYFYDEKRKLFTDTNMHDEKLRYEAECFYDHLQTLPGAKELADLPGGYDLVLQIKTDQPLGLRWFYYYVSHKYRCLFWLQEYPVENLIQEGAQVVGVQSLAHIQHQLEHFYWAHWSLYPVSFDQHMLSKGVYDELLGMLVYGSIDIMTSKTSALWLDEDQMQRMIRLIQDAKTAKAGDVYYVAGTTRLLSFFANWRFEDHHGQQSARLKKNEAIYVTRRERSFLITVISPLLFFAPQKYLAELEEAWLDEHILAPVWKSLMTKMSGEWGDLILWSTVMLSVNVGFLAVPSVLPSPSSTAAAPATPNQISNSLSLIASVGSIVVGLLLVRHHLSKKDDDPAGAARYLHRNDHKYIGLEPMAIVFSLPWALLMWAMMLFAIELLTLCLSHTDTRIRVPVGIISALVAAPITWCMWNSWTARNDSGV